MAFIEVKNLKYRYPLSTELTLDDLSFSIEKGEFIGVLGANNAGKSTLCSAIAGIVPHFYKGAYGGTITVDNLIVADSEMADICCKVGMIFQNPFNQITGAKLTVFEEIAFGLENLGIEKTEMERRVYEVMELLDIAQYRDRSPFALSGGQMQRLAIASILVMQPDIIVLDEPTSQLDPRGTEEVFQAIQKLTEQGITIIMVEHKIEKLALYSDKMLLLHEGKLIDFAAPEVIFSRPDIQDYAVDIPVYTEIAKGLGITMETGFYPTTLAQLTNLLRKEL